jgi:hypothetical protein
VSVRTLPFAALTAGLGLPLACAADAPSAPPPPPVEAPVPDPIGDAIQQLRSEHDTADLARVQAALAADPLLASARLIEAMQRGSASTVMLDALGMLGTPQGLRFLDRALYEGDPAWRMAAASALTRHPDGPTVLAPALAHPDPMAAAAAVVGWAAAPGGCDRVRPALGHPDLLVRLSTLDALARHGCLTEADRAAAAADPAPEVRAWAVDQPPTGPK